MRIVRRIGFVHVFIKHADNKITVIEMIKMFCHASSFFCALRRDGTSTSIPETLRRIMPLSSWCHGFGRCQLVQRTDGSSRLGQSVELICSRKPYKVGFGMWCHAARSKIEIIVILTCERCPKFLCLKTEEDSKIKRGWIESSGNVQNQQASVGAEYIMRLSWFFSIYIQTLCCHRANDGKAIGLAQNFQ